MHVCFIRLYCSTWSTDGLRIVHTVYEFYGCSQTNPFQCFIVTFTVVNPAGDAGDTSPQYFGWGDVNGNIPPILLRTIGYSRPLLVAFRSLSLKPISFGYKTPPVRFSQAGGQSADKARPPNLELALTSPLVTLSMGG